MVEVQSKAVNTININVKEAQCETLVLFLNLKDFIIAILDGA